MKTKLDIFMDAISSLFVTKAKDVWGDLSVDEKREAREKLNNLEPDISNLIKTGLSIVDRPLCRDIFGEDVPTPKGLSGFNFDAASLRESLRNCAKDDLSFECFVNQINAHPLKDIMLTKIKALDPEVHNKIVSKINFESSKDKDDLFLSEPVDVPFSVSEDGSSSEAKKLSRKAELLGSYYNALVKTGMDKDLVKDLVLQESKIVGV